MDLQKQLDELADTVGEMGRVIAELQDANRALKKRVDEMGDVRSDLHTIHKDVKTVHDNFTSFHNMEYQVLSAVVEDLSTKIEGRNKSAPVKRNMTDADALRVLNGDMAGLNHKEAADAMGLTYAQVYSCRGGFTFKHVIHELERKGWKNTWEKPKKQNR